MDDEALLQEELRASPGRKGRGRSGGANAITAIGLAITIVLWAVTGLLLAFLLDGPSGSGVIDPKSLVALFVFGIEMFAAAMLSGRVWAAIGPGPRAVLRAIGVLGPVPTLAIALFMTLAAIAPFLMPFLPAKTPAGPRPGLPPTSEGAAVTGGRNWRFAQVEDRGATYSEALEICRQEGERLPSLDDLERFDPPLPLGKAVWIEKPVDADLPLERRSNGHFVAVSSQSGRDVVCFRP